MLHDSSVAAHDAGVEANDGGSMENDPAESRESAVKPDPRSPGWIRRYSESSSLGIFSLAVLFVPAAPDVDGV